MTDSPELTPGQLSRLRAAMDLRDDVGFDRLVKRAAEQTAMVQAIQEGLGLTVGGGLHPLRHAIFRLQAERDVVRKLIGVDADSRLHETIQVISELMETVYYGPNGRAETAAPVEGPTDHMPLQVNAETERIERIDYPGALAFAMFEVRPMGRTGDEHEQVDQYVIVDRRNGLAASTSTSTMDEIAKDLVTLATRQSGDSTITVVAPREVAEGLVTP
jgi:hypothetical protein